HHPGHLLHHEGASVAKGQVAAVRHDAIGRHGKERFVRNGPRQRFSFIVIAAAVIVSGMVSTYVSSQSNNAPGVAATGSTVDVYKDPTLNLFTRSNLAHNRFSSNQPVLWLG